MPTGSANEPIRSFRFRVEINGISGAEFMECRGLESVTDVIEYREGGDRVNTVRKLPGLTRYANIVLVSGVTNSMALYQWRSRVIEGQAELKDIAICLMDATGADVARWVFRNCWPCRLSGPDLVAGESGIAIEELEICHEGIKRDS
jgi:phage tail-like protein